MILVQFVRVLYLVLLYMVLYHIPYNLLLQGVFLLHMPDYFDTFFRHIRVDFIGMISPSPVSI